MIEIHLTWTVTYATLFLCIFYLCNSFYLLAIYCLLCVTHNPTWYIVYAPFYFSIPLKPQLVICFTLCVIGRDPTWVYNICILNLSSLLIIVCSPGVRSILEVLDGWSISGSGKHVLVQLKLNTYRLSVDLATQFRWTTISLVVIR